MQNDPLSQLRDIHLPEPGGLWPPAPGWWVLAAVILATGFAFGIWLLRRHRRNRWIKSAKQELERIRNSDCTESEKLDELNRLLKRAARRRYPDQHPESLSGDPWIAFLTEKSGRNDGRLEQVFRNLAQSSWHPEPQVSFADAERAARTWLGAQRC